MTPEERLAKLEEAMLVNSALLNRMEQRSGDHKEWLEAHNAAVRRHDEEIEQLRGGLVKLMSAIQKTNDAAQITSAAVAGLTATVDRFIRGQGGNGQKQ